ncbi:unnamed protein product [Polarella glacialis]|uniref:Uncharacterized protein n=1 Tax=Polarella glacialis TaxID=89957 RepID=A0A813JJY8_POLGL|nr:unnamed protein product [Polarella glacialis]
MVFSYLAAISFARETSTLNSILGFNMYGTCLSTSTIILGLLVAFLFGLGCGVTYLVSYGEVLYCCRSSGYGGGFSCGAGSACSVCGLFGIASPAASCCLPLRVVPSPHEHRRGGAGYHIGGLTAHRSGLLYAPRFGSPADC